MAYATRAKAAAARRTTSPEKAAGEEHEACACGHCEEQGEEGGDALSVEGSDAALDLAFGLAADEMAVDGDDSDQGNPFSPTGDDDDEERGDDDEEESDSDDGPTDDDRSEGELEDTAAEMRELEQTVNLTNMFQLVDRLGEGTFSSVYKAIDLHHDCYDNSQWAPIEVEQLPTPAPTSASEPYFPERKRKRSKTKRVYVALKRIYVTSSPQRIQNELDILARLRGCRNVAYLVSAFRHEDQVIAVMPYERHQDFRDFYRTASLSLMRSYFTCMFSGLADAHERNIIHRDVKPANFLYNIHTGQGTLCDFGLAQVFDPLEWTSHCLHSLPQPAAGKPHGARLKRPTSVFEQVVEQIEEDRTTAWQPTDAEWEILSEAHDEDDAFYQEWEPACHHGPGRVGYLKPEHDKRPSARANRAGTRGFRAPEVLFKCPDQTISIDIWSVGIMLLCFLTRRFPFFNSNDDIEALMEIATIFGKTRVESSGALHNRVFTTNVPSTEQLAHVNLHELVRALNPKILAENRPADRDADDVSWYDGSQLFHAVDLMKRCLALDCTRRITAQQALRHPFFDFTDSMAI